MSATATPQNILNLRKANQIRLKAHAVRREIAAGTLTIADAIEDPRVGGTVYALVMARPFWGRYKTQRLLGRLRMSEYLRVRDLTDRQRRLLTEECS